MSELSSFVIDQIPSLPVPEIAPSSPSCAHVLMCISVPRDVDTSVSMSVPLACRSGLEDSFRVCFPRTLVEDDELEVEDDPKPCMT
jgi:hypothetical protein